MVSVDHFVYELRRQLNDAADQGASEIVMTSRGLARSEGREQHGWTLAAKRCTRSFEMAMS
jgi:hypothetical protein